MSRKRRFGSSVNTKKKSVEEKPGSNVNISAKAGEILEQSSSIEKIFDVEINNIKIRKKDLKARKAADEEAARKAAEEEAARKTAEKEALRNKAAVKIQAMERGRQDKEKFKKNKEAITTIQAISRGREGRRIKEVKKKGEVVKNETEGFRNFIEKIKKFKLVDTDELDGVIKETNDLIDKTDGYMRDGTLTSNELLLTIFEANDVLSNFQKVLYANPKLVKYMEEISDKLKEEEQKIINLLSEIGDLFTITKLPLIKNEWDKLQKEDDKKIITLMKNDEQDKVTVKKRKLELINKYIDSANVESEVIKISVELKDLSKYVEFIKLILKISKSFILIWILNRIGTIPYKKEIGKAMAKYTNEGPIEYKTNYENFLKLAEEEGYDAVNQNDTFKGINQSIENLKDLIKRTYSEYLLRKFRNMFLNPDEKQSFLPISEVIGTELSIRKTNNNVVEKIQDLKNKIIDTGELSEQLGYNENQLEAKNPLIIYKKLDREKEDLKKNLYDSWADIKKEYKDFTVEVHEDDKKVINTDIEGIIQKLPLKELNIIKQIVYPKTIQYLQELKDAAELKKSEDKKETANKQFLKFKEESLKVLNIIKQRFLSEINYDNTDKFSVIEGQIEIINFDKTVDINGIDKELGTKKDQINEKILKANNILENEEKEILQIVPTKELVDNEKKYFEAMNKKFNHLKSIGKKLEYIDIKNDENNTYFKELLQIKKELDNAEQGTMEKTKKQIIPSDKIKRYFESNINDMISIKFIYKLLKERYRENFYYLFKIFYELAMIEQNHRRINDKKIVQEAICNEIPSIEQLELRDFFEKIKHYSTNYNDNNIELHKKLKKIYDILQKKYEEEKEKEREKAALTIQSLFRWKKIRKTAAKKIKNKRDEIKKEINTSYKKIKEKPFYIKIEDLELSSEKFFDGESIKDELLYEDWEEVAKQRYTHLSDEDKNKQIISYQGKTLSDLDDYGNEIGDELFGKRRKRKHKFGSTSTKSKNIRLTIQNYESIYKQIQEKLQKAIENSIENSYFLTPNETSKSVAKHGGIVDTFKNIKNRLNDILGKKEKDIEQDIKKAIEYTKKTNFIQFLIDILKKKYILVFDSEKKKYVTDLDETIYINLIEYYRPFHKEEKLKTQSWKIYKNTKLGIKDVISRLKKKYKSEFEEYLINLSLILDIEHEKEYSPSGITVYTDQNKKDLNNDPIKYNPKEYLDYLKEHKEISNPRLLKQILNKIKEEQKNEYGELTKLLNQVKDTGWKEEQDSLEKPKRLWFYKIKKGLTEKEKAILKVSLNAQIEKEEEEKVKKEAKIDNERMTKGNIASQKEHIINLLKKVTDQSFIEKLEHVERGKIYGFVILTNDEEELETLRIQIKNQIEKEEEEKEVRGKKEQEESRKRREEEERRLREAKELERERKKAREERKKRINDAKNLKKKEIMNEFEYLLKGYEMKENFSEYLTFTMSRKSKLKRKYVDYFKFKEKELKEAHMGIINIKNLKKNNRKLKEIKELLKRESKKHTFLGLGFGEVEQIDYKEIKLEEIETVVRKFIQKNATFVIRSLGRDYKTDLSVKAYLEFIKEQ